MPRASPAPATRVSRPPPIERDDAYKITRYAVLFLVCFFNLALLYVIETPAGLEDTIINVMKVDTAQYTLLFSVLAWPNTILCVINGFVVDRVLGLALGYVFFICIVTLGQLLFAAGAFLNLFWVMLAGRFVIGLGSETLYFLGQVFYTIWFKGGNINLAYTLGMSSGRLGGLIALSAQEFLNDQFDFVRNPRYRLGITLLVGFCLMILGLAAGLCVSILQKWRDKSNDKSKATQNKSNMLLSCSFTRSIKFWLSVGIIAAVYCVLAAIAIIGQKFYLHKFGFTIVFASIVNSLMFGGVILISPLLGLLIDTAGYQLYWALCGIVLLLISCISLAGSLPHMSYLPLLVCVVTSVAYGINVSAIWSLPSFLVNDNETTTAYCMVGSFANLFLSVVEIVTGVLVDDEGYLVTFIFICYLIDFGIILLFCLFLVDLFSESNKLNLSGSEKRAKSKMEKRLRNGPSNHIN